MSNRKTIIVLLLLTLAGGVSAYAEETSKDLTFKAYRKQPETDTGGSFTLTVLPYDLSYYSEGSDWDITDALAAAGTSSEEGYLADVGLFRWSFECTGTSLQSDAAGPFTISFTVSGPMESTSSTEKVNYKLKITTEPGSVNVNGTETGLDSTAPYGDTQVRGYTSYLSTDFASGNNIRIRDHITVAATNMTERDVSADDLTDGNSPFQFTYINTTSSSTNLSLTFAPEGYHSSTWLALSTFSQEVGGTITFTRSGNGFLQVNQAEYEDAKTVGGRYEATVTVTITST